jgi:hypothetical protein
MYIQMSIGLREEVMVVPGFNTYYVFSFKIHDIL